MLEVAFARCLFPSLFVAFHTHFIGSDAEQYLDVSSDFSVDATIVENKIKLYTMYTYVHYVHICTLYKSKASSSVGMQSGVCFGKEANLSTGERSVFLIGTNVSRR